MAISACYNNNCGNHYDGDLTGIQSAIINLIIHYSHKNKKYLSVHKWKGFKQIWLWVYDIIVYSILMLCSSFIIY